MESGVRVVNLSLTGPDNQVLERSLELARDKGIFIVAAVGNNGPAAPAQFPAAYDSVFAATAIDHGNRPYLRAGRGEHLDYAAPGVDLLVADATSENAYRRVTGTSFATPFVTGLIVHHLSIAPQESSGLQALLDADTIDLGEPGPDPVFGRGLVGSSLIVAAPRESKQ